VCGLSFKKQTVLLGAIRSPDTLHTLKLKAVTVWIRQHILQNADPMTGFMHGAFGDSLPLFEQLDRDFERLPLHAAHHIMLAMQVVGTEHPDAGTAQTALCFYHDAVNAQHLNPETYSQYRARYADNRDRMETGTS
jgi:hypothetical protein